MIGCLVAYFMGLVTVPLIVWFICMKAETVKPNDELYERALKQREELKNEK